MRVCTRVDEIREEEYQRNEMRTTWKKKGGKILSCKIFGRFNTYINCSFFFYDLKIKNV